jgi:sugar phosphate isomerase/epimerase
MIREAITEIMPVAADLHVTLALEPMHPNCGGDWTVVTDLDAACRVLDEFDSPFLKLVFDTYHLAHDARIVHRIEEIAGRIAVVHLGDAKSSPEKEQNRTRLGTGALPLQDVIDALSAAGYDGYYDVELVGEEFHPDHYFDVLDHSKQAFGELTRQQAVGRSA